MFRAYDATRERLVAVKLFKLDLPPERVHRLVAEFERILAARLEHPALVAPVATGIVGVSAYLAQDYIAAESLDLAIREYGPAPPADAIRVAAELAGALDFACTVKVAHGALHPRDVLLSSEETRLTGIGVAHALESVGVVAPVRRPYTAPERIAGAAWDRRADVFSLAALMHELLWGRRPTGLGAQAALSLTEVAGGDLSALRDAFARALADNPAERFDTALAFADALVAAFPNITPAPPQPHEQPSRGSHGLRNIDDRRLTTAAAREPLLPLDGDTQRTLVAPSAQIADMVRGAALQVQPPVESIDVPIAAIDAAEADRDRDAEVSPSIADDESTIVDRQISFVDRQSAAADSQPAFADQQSAFAPQSAIRNPPLFESALERSRSAVWPLALALGVGLAVGFAGGYGVGTHSRSDAAAVGDGPVPATTDTAPPTARAAPNVATASPGGREFTESAVAPPPKATPPPVALDGSGRTPARLNADVAVTGPGRLLVRSTPAGARVTIDGRDYGRTPLPVRDLTNGPHRVRVTRNGYIAAERRIVITPARPSQAMNVELARANVAPRAAQATPAPATPGTAGRFAGTLIVDSRPTGARVYVDGKLAGTTPLSIPEVRAGEHAIRIERDGYRRWSSSVRVVAAEQNRVTASLER